MQILRRHLQEHGIQANWSTVRQWLSSQLRVTEIFQRPDGRALHMRKATRPEGQHLAICQALGIATSNPEASKNWFTDTAKPKNRQFVVPHADFSKRKSLFYKPCSFLVTNMG